MAAEKGLGLARVAAAAGVTVATVSNTINRPHLVAPSTRERIRAVMKELDFVPNRAAATLRKGSARLIGLVVPEILNPFYAAVTESVAVAAGEEGYALALCVSHDDPVVERRHFEMLAEHRAAGVIVVPLLATTERLTQLRMVGTHLVLIDRVETSHDSCSVVVDDVAGGRLAANHLLGRPDTRALMIVNGALTIPQCADRLTGTLQAVGMRDRGAHLVQYETKSMSIEDGVAVGRMIVESGSPRDVFCTNDQLAFGVIRGMHEGGLDVPRDARVVGYGDLALATEGEIQITSVAQPKAEMGRAALGHILAEIADGATHRHSTTIFVPELVVRTSAPAA